MRSITAILLCRVLCKFLRSLLGQLANEYCSIRSNELDIQIFLLSSFIPGHDEKLVADGSACDERRVKSFTHLRCDKGKRNEHLS